MVFLEVEADDAYVREGDRRLMGFFVLSYGGGGGGDSDLVLFVMKNFFLDFLWSLAFWNFLVLECY